MGLRKWNVFLAVVDSGSYTKAGEELGYTQAGITQMMKSLEKEVGFPLFHKGHQAFRQEYPGIHFDISEGNEYELSCWIRDHKVDIAFTSYQNSSSYHFIHLYDDPMLAVMPKGHPLAVYDEIPLDLFESSAFVVSDYTYLNDVHRILKTAGVTPDIKYTSHNDYSILSMVEHNLGISILPALILRGKTGNFEARPLKPYAVRRLGMAVASATDMSPAMKIFIEYAKNFLKV